MTPRQPPPNPPRGRKLRPIFLRASTDFQIMVDCAETSLHELNLQYQRSGKQTIVELEVDGPAYFRVVLERDQAPMTRGILLPSESRPEVTYLQVRFELGASADQQLAAARDARRFIGVLVEKLPAKPWLGLGWMSSRREKKRWKQVLPESN